MQPGREMGCMAVVAVILACALAVILTLAVKIHLLQKAAREISAAVRVQLTEDTNALITLSTRDRHMRALAGELNDQLRVLRDQRRLYQNGDRALKEAVTNIAHDLRTPLTSLCGYIDLCKREALSEKAARYLSLIENRADALKALTQELFRYSVITSSVQELPLTPVDLRAVLEEGVAAFYGALLQRGIEPVISLPDAPVLRPLNREAIARVVSNILGNAIQYSDGDLSISLSPSGEIVFSNAASALSQVQVGRLFERFFTVETAHHSTGLGLSIARTLVERMHGAIDASYAEGRLILRIVFPSKAPPV